MCPEDLQTFIRLLEARGQLSRIRVTVDPVLEAAAIIDRVCKAPGGGRALLFEAVAGSDLPLAANLFGSSERIAMALGVETLAALAERLRGDLAATGLASSERALQQLMGSCDRLPVVEPNPSCFAEDLSESGLAALPALHCWPGDGGRYLTLGQVFTRHPATGSANCGMYRMQIVDAGTALLRCHPGSGGSEHLAAWHARGEAAPIAVAFGGPSVLTWVAGMPLPGDVDEVTFAGYLAGRPLCMARCRHSDLRVPADAEIVIEGQVYPDEARVEGPFGNHTGSYVSAAMAPVLRVERVWARHSAIFPATVVGPPPMENVHLATAVAQILLVLLQHDYPWVKDVHLPVEGIYHQAALVSVDAPERSGGEICDTICRSALLRRSRLLVLLDSGSDLRNIAQVYWRGINGGPWTGRVLVEKERLVVDARTPSWCMPVQPDQETLQRVRESWESFGIED